MRYDSYEIHRKAHSERAIYIGTLIASAIAAIAQFVSKAWRSSSSKGTNSSALS